MTQEIVFHESYVFVDEDKGYPQFYRGVSQVKFHFHQRQPVKVSFEDGVTAGHWNQDHGWIDVHLYPHPVGPEVDKEIHDGYPYDRIGGRLRVKVEGEDERDCLVVLHADRSNGRSSDDETTCLSEDRFEGIPQGTYTLSVYDGFETFINLLSTCY